MKKMTLERARKELAQIQARDKANDISGSFHLGRVGFRKQTKRYLYSIERGINDAIRAAKLQSFINAKEAELNRPPATPKVERVKEVKPTWSSLPADQQYVLMGCYLGNGQSVYNSAREVNGDYESIAHISEDGQTISYRKKNLPQHVIQWVEEAATSMIDARAQKLAEVAKIREDNIAWYLRMGYTVSQIERVYGPINSQQPAIVGQ